MNQYSIVDLHTNSTIIFFLIQIDSYKKNLPKIKNYFAVKKNFTSNLKIFFVLFKPSNEFLN